MKKFSMPVATTMKMKTISKASNPVPNQKMRSPDDASQPKRKRRMWVHGAPRRKTTTTPMR
jgi:hypothetical protein